MAWAAAMVVALVMVVLVAVVAAVSAVAEAVPLVDAMGVAAAVTTECLVADLVAFSVLGTGATMVGMAILIVVALAWSSPKSQLVERAEVFSGQKSSSGLRSFLSSPSASFSS